MSNDFNLSEYMSNGIENVVKVVIQDKINPVEKAYKSSSSLVDALKSPLFTKLDEMGMLIGEYNAGCLLFEKENEVKELIRSCEQKSNV